MKPQQGIYTGKVVHRRLRPRPHNLIYRAYWLFVELPVAREAPAFPRLLSFDRWNLFSIRGVDHGEGDGGNPRDVIVRYCREAGVELGAGPRIFLLTMPRILGYVFNPLSVYFCYRADDALLAIVYEVHNTFGQRHSYVMPVAANATPDDAIRQHSDKRFYVSPFLPMDMTYTFTVTRPAETLSVAITGNDAEGPLILTSLSARRSALSSPGLLRVFFTHPLVAMKVVGAIHWEALFIWLKGIKLVRRPPPPPTPITVGPVRARGKNIDVE